MPILVFLLDAHQMVIELWVELLQTDPRFKVVGTAKNTKDTLAFITTHSHSSVILFIGSVPEKLDAVILQHQLKDINEKQKTLAITDAGNEVYMHLLKQAGVAGFLFEETSTTELFQAILALHNNEKTLPVYDIDMPSTELHFVRDLQDLSKREWEILAYLRKGFSSKEIGLQTGLSPRTVDIHRFNILHQTHQPNTAALINKLLINGL